MSIDSQVARLRRRLSRWRLEPAARGQARAVSGRQSASTDETSQLPTSQWSRGYSDDDLSVFDGFPPVPGKSQSGFIVDFLGVRTRVAHAAPFAGFDGKVFSTPVPVGDWFHAETIEYVGLLKCVVTAKRSLRGPRAPEPAGVRGWLAVRRQPSAGESRTSGFTGSRGIPNTSPPCRSTSVTTV